MATDLLVLNLVFHLAEVPTIIELYRPNAEIEVFIFYVFDYLVEG